MTNERPALEQLWMNYSRAFKSQIRLKHSIRADNEINHRLPAARKEFEKSVQQGILPAPPNMATEVLGE